MDRASNETTFEQLLEIGTALSAQPDIERLLEHILVSAKSLLHADGGTLYTVSEDGKRLHFEILRNDTLQIATGGTTGNTSSFVDLALYAADGTPNTHMVAACAALEQRTINISDAYADTAYDFSGTRAFDQQTGYRSRSFLTVPMRDHEGELIGVLQLINKLDPESGVVLTFGDDDRRLAESLASQAAVALTNRRLIASLHELFESLIEMIAGAIDEKSPHTGGHCRRVPDIAMRLAEACARVGQGPLAGFTMDEADRYELKIAAWLHDCGKITTPVHVVEKSTKLETIHDRIELVGTRYEILRRDAEISRLQARLTALEANAQPTDTDTDTDHDHDHDRHLAELDEELRFLRRANFGSERMSRENLDRIDRIAGREWRDADGALRRLLSEDELYNLSVERGTLTAEERAIITGHIDTTIRMLDSLTFPRHLRKVPEFAGGHHERMDGKGYPRGLLKHEMSVQARIMGLADIFEALTANDRPYREPNTLSESLQIMGRMCTGGHIDPDLFAVFVHQRVYLEYAREHLGAAQIDAVDHDAIPGYAEP